MAIVRTCAPRITGTLISLTPSGRSRSLGAASLRKDPAMLAMVVTSATVDSPWPHLHDTSTSDDQAFVELHVLVRHDTPPAGRSPRRQICQQVSYCHTNRRVLSAWRQQQPRMQTAATSESAGDKTDDQSIDREIAAIALPVRHREDSLRRPLQLPADWRPCHRP